MGCKTRRSKHLFKNKKSLRYRNKKRRTQKAGGGDEGINPPGADAAPAAPAAPPEDDDPKVKGDEDVIANTIMSNINKASSIGLQFFNNSVSGVLDGVAKKMNIDSSKPALDVAGEGAAKLAKIASVMGTPEGDKLKEKFSNVLVELVDTTKPALDEVTKVGEEFLDKSGTAAVNAGLNMVGAVPGVGTTVELIRVLNNAGQAFNAGVDAAADLTKVGSDAAVKVHAITEKAGNLMEEASDLADNVNNLTELPDITSIPVPGLAPLPGVPEIKVPKVPNLIVPSPGLLNNPKEDIISTQEGTAQVAGGIRTLSQLQKAGKRIENRVESSLKEFNKNTKTRKKVRFNL
jgi:hypothetical protein